MDLGRGVVWAAISIIVLTSVVSGPIVPALDLTSPRDDAPGISFAAEDDLDASLASLPEGGVALVQGRFGAGAYTLDVPDAAVDVNRVRGSPRLVYKVRIPDLGFVRATVHFVGPEHEGSRLTLSVEPVTFDPDRITEDDYDGVLLVVARADATAETIGRQNVTIEVRS